MGFSRAPWANLSWSANLTARRVKNARVSDVWIVHVYPARVSETEGRERISKNHFLFFFFQKRRFSIDIERKFRRFRGKRSIKTDVISTIKYNIYNPFVDAMR